MRRIGLAALALLAASGSVQAKEFDADRAYRRMERLMQSWLAPKGGHEIIAPPGDIDPRMAIKPPRQGTMRVITPPGDAGR